MSDNRSIWVLLKDFNDFYRLKAERIDFCKQNGISTAGGKIEIAERIRHFILTGDVIKDKSKKSKTKSKFDWGKERLTLGKVITDNYKNGENVRSFLLERLVLIKQRRN